jgi:periplasmic protein TonB
MVTVVFEGFDEAPDPRARKRLFASTGASLVVYAAVGVVVVALAGNQVVKEPRRPVEVAFHRPAPRPTTPPPPPPPPPPRAARKKARVAGNAPAIPTELSEERLAEGDERDFQSLLGTLGTDAIVQAGGAIEDLLKPAPPPRRPERRAPLELPEDAIAPVPETGNPRPTYPDAARRQGREGVVVLRVVIDADGAVGDVEVLAGEEPFVAAALAAVKRWRYRPALIAGAPAAVHREIRLPFRLRSRA